MATYESVGSVGINNNVTSIAVPKPAGLAVGDYMLAGIYFQCVGITGINAPAGWATVTTETRGTSSNEKYLVTFSKIATSDDVAASTFSFSRAGGVSSGPAGGHIVRVSNFGVQAGSVDGNDSVSSGQTSKTISSFTPTRANSLLLAFIGLGAGVTEDEYSITSVALATNNPTWTKRAEVRLDVTSNTHAFAVFSATRPEATATGTITSTFSNPNNTVDFLASVVATGPVVNGSITPTTKVNAYAFSPIQSAVVDAIVDQPTFDSMTVTQWQNESKPSTTWNNTDK
jgi:hypothetical protein